MDTKSQAESCKLSVAKEFASECEWSCEWNSENVVLVAEYACEWKFAIKFASDCECDGLVHPDKMCLSYRMRAGGGEIWGLAASTRSPPDNGPPAVVMSASFLHLWAVHVWLLPALLWRHSSCHWYVIGMCLGSWGPAKCNPPATKKKFQKPRLSPKVSVISPKVNVISPKVNVLSPQVNVQHFGEFLKNLKFLKFPVGGSRSQGFRKYPIFNGILEGSLKKPQGTILRHQKNNLKRFLASTKPRPWRRNTRGTPNPLKGVWFSPALEREGEKKNFAGEHTQQQETERGLQTSMRTRGKSWRAPNQTSPRPQRPKIPHKQTKHLSRKHLTKNPPHQSNRVSEKLSQQGGGAHLVAPSTGWMLYYPCFSPSTAIGPPLR